MQAICQITDRCDLISITSAAELLMESYEHAYFRNHEFLLDCVLLAHIHTYFNKQKQSSVVVRIDRNITLQNNFLHCLSSWNQGNDPVALRLCNGKHDVIKCRKNPIV